MCRGSADIFKHAEVLSVHNNWILLQISSWEAHTSNLNVEYRTSCAPVVLQPVPLVVAILGSFVRSLRATYSWREREHSGNSITSFVSLRTQSARIFLFSPRGPCGFTLHHSFITCVFLVLFTIPSLRLKFKQGGSQTGKPGIVREFSRSWSARKYPQKSALAREIKFFFCGEAANDICSGRRTNGPVYDVVDGSLNLWHPKD